MDTYTAIVGDDTRADTIARGSLRECVDAIVSDAAGETLHAALVVFVADPIGAPEHNDRLARLMSDAFAAGANYGRVDSADGSISYYIRRAA